MVMGIYYHVPLSNISWLTLTQIIWTYLLAA